jgi:hypothetical protein
MSDEYENAIYCPCHCENHDYNIPAHALECPCKGCYCDHMDEQYYGNYYEIEAIYDWLSEETPYGYCRYCDHNCKKQIDLKETKLYFDLWRKYILFLKKQTHN